MDFILGCNYWASNAGADMWRDFDEEAVREDLRVLAAHGVTHIRAFPNWRDFQPVMPLYRGQGILNGYCMEGETAPDNPYYLDGVMMERFGRFLDICDELGIRVVVGLLTGWMSGRLYVPSALYDKNVLTDPVAIYFEQLFIRGFVTAFRSRSAIYAWDLGNECNCMAGATRIQAVNWTATVASAIRAYDSTRPVISGMHGIEADRGAVWQIGDQAMWTDILTTHPYPYWCSYTRNDEIRSLRTTMHATAQNKYYSECAGKPCLAEEIGTMGPMLCSNDAAADFLRVNLFSLWANGAAGVMWWCGHDQTMLTAFPYSENMVELELGLLNPDRSPKPVIKELGRFSEFLRSVDITLPEARTDAVCILSEGQRQWGVCYASHVLARQAGLNLRFCHVDGELPESDAYLLPSVNGVTVMDAGYYKKLRERVYNGAELYVSMDNGVLSQFEMLTGMRVIDSYESPESRSFTFRGQDYSFTTKRTYVLESVGADVLARDNTGNPVISVHRYGKGRVTYINFPVEENLIDGHNAFDSKYFELYKQVFSSRTAYHPVRIQGDGVFTTLHVDKKANKLYAVSVNHTGERVKINIESDPYRLCSVLHGSIDTVAPYDAAVFEFVLK